MFISEIAFVSSSQGGFCRLLKLLFAA